MWVNTNLNDYRTNIDSFDDSLPGILYSMSFSPDRGTLVKGQHNKIVLLDVATGTSIASPPLGPNLVSMLLSPDGTTLASGSSRHWGNGTFLLWDLQSPQLQSPMLM